LERDCLPEKFPLSAAVGSGRFGIDRERLVGCLKAGPVLDLLEDAIKKWGYE
jgi:hypothetical protein